MKTLTCEMCGSNDLIKQEGLYICQHCGTKYSVEEAKKLMIEGTVKIDNSDAVNNNLINARKAKDIGDWSTAAKYYNLVKQDKPDNYEADFYSAFSEAQITLRELDDPKRGSAFNVLMKRIETLDVAYKTQISIGEDVETPKSTIPCPKCARDIPYTANVCPFCGLDIRQKLRPNEYLFTSMATDIGKMLTSSFSFHIIKQEQGFVIKTFTDEYITYTLFYGIMAYFKQAVDRILKTDDKPYLHKAILILCDYAQKSPWKELEKANISREKVLSSIIEWKTDAIKGYLRTQNPAYWETHPNEKTDLEGELTASRQAIEKEKATAANSPTKSSKGGCYVATAVYGSYDCPQVWTLRRYRDNTLAGTWYGRAFIRAYYAVSPTLVKRFGDTEWFKRMWKGKLDRMVANLQKKGYESTPYEDRNW